MQEVFPNASHNTKVLKRMDLEQISALADVDLGELIDLTAQFW
jgi:hypothetical protein